MLLGTREEVPIEPVEKPKFIEDMNEMELAQAVSFMFNSWSLCKSPNKNSSIFQIELPAGLTNLGNTCYMNATIQCLRSVPELRESLKEFTDEVSFASPQSITFALKNVFDQMEKAPTVTPILLLQTLHMAFPNFAQTGENGAYRQQDANECWSEMLKMLQQKLPPKTGANSTKHSSVIEQFFGGSFDCEMKCVEAEDEVAAKSKENFLQLSCFISTEVKYMHSGLK